MHGSRKRLGHGIVSREAIPVAIPLEEPLRWGAMSVRVKGGVLVMVTTDEGVVGYGEAGFSAEYFPTVGPIVNQQLAPVDSVRLLRQPATRNAPLRLKSVRAFVYCP